MKITSKVLGKGLEKALSNLIRSNQKAFVNGRSIFDPIRTIDDIVDYTKRNNWSGILIAIAFEKPFDTLDKTVVYEDLELEKKKNKSLYLEMTRPAYHKKKYLIQICSLFSNLLVSVLADIILLGDNSLHEKDSQNTVFVNLSKFRVYIFWL